MKFILNTVITLLVFSFCSFGQNTRDVISGYTGKISKYECLLAKYNFEVKDAKGNLKFSTLGEFYSQGDKFVVKTPASEIYCNGDFKSIYDKSSDEIILIGHNSNDSNMSENPFIAVKSEPASYNFNSKAKSVLYDGEESLLITLIPQNTKADHTAVEICVRKADNNIQTITYISKGGDRYTAKIISMTESGKKSDSFFELDIDSIPDVYVTDLR